jgi:hypothetical protein
MASRNTSAGNVKNISNRLIDTMPINQEQNTKYSHFTEMVLALEQLPEY